MKKLILGTILLLLVVFTWADVYPIGTLGTSSSSTYSPFNGYYDFGWTKTIFTSAELTAAGYDGTDNIVGVGYYVGNTPSNWMIQDVHMFIRHTTLTSYTTTADETGTAMPDSLGFTQVFSGNLTLNGGGWYYITFNLNSFDWDGTSNLEIFWKNWDGDYVTGYPTWRYNSQSPDYKTVYKQQDNTWPTTAGTRSYSRSNLAIVTPQLDPPNPATLAYPTDNGWAFLDATLSWSDGGGMPTSYDVYLDTENPPASLVSDDQAGTSFAPTLMANTTYYWQVVPRNGNGEAADCPVWSFKTPTSTQLAESFEDAVPPVGWTNPGSWSRGTTYKVHGTAGAYKSGSTTTSYVLSGPKVTITESSTLDFWAAGSSTTGAILQVIYSPDRVNWTQIGDNITYPATYTFYNHVIDLSSLAGNDYYVGFRNGAGSSTNYIDCVFGPEITAEAPDPVTQVLPADAAIDVSQFPTFTWTSAITGGVPSGFRVYCDTNADPSTLLADVSTLSYTATTALSYSTMYYWKVVAYNSTGDAVGSTIRSFTTLADPTIYTLPWGEDFGTTGTVFPPANWFRGTGALADPSTVTPSTTYWIQDNWMNDTTVTPVNFSARMNIYSTNRYGWFITPPIQMPGAGYQLEFDLALTDYANANPISSDPNGTTGVDDRFIVLIGNGSSWTPANAVREWNNTGSPYVYNDIPNTGLHVTLPLDSYSGVYYVAFYGESTVSNADNDFFVDNVMVRQTPAGLPDYVTLNSPADAATGIDPANVLLGWTASLAGGTPEYYEIYVGADPIDPGTGYYGEYSYESTNPFFDLSAQTDITIGYSQTLYWAVLPFNGGATPQSPDPNNPAFMVWSFTTAPDPAIVALPYEENFDSVTAPAMPWGWSAYASSTSTSAYARTYNSSTYAYTAPNSVYMTNSSDAAADLRIVTPPISVPMNSIKLKFFARGSSTGYSLLVGTVNAPDGTGVFNQIASIPLTAVQTEYTVPLSGYLGTDNYICFKHGLGGTYRSIYIDNVQLIEIVDNDLVAISLTGPSYGDTVTPLSYTLEVMNDGLLSQSSYTVQLLSVDTRTVLYTENISTTLDPSTTAQHTLTWTPSAGGIYNVYGKVILTGDQTPANDETGTKTVYIIPSGADVLLVGNPDTTTKAATLPANFYYKNSVTETLYFNDETHLASGTIDALVYKNNFISNITGKPLKIWMAHTAVTDLSGGWLPALDYTLVFDGTIDLPSGINEVVIPLTTPFAYTGGTLAVRVNRPIDTVFYNTNDHWYYTDTAATHTVRSRYLQSDSVTYDPLAPSAAGTTNNYVPNTWFVVSGAVMQTGAILEGYVYQQDGVTPIVGATVNLTERLAATTDDTGFYQFTFWNNTAVDVTASMAGYYNQSFTNIALTLGSTVTQNFSLTALPRVTVSGTVTANDFPAGLSGATITLTGTETYLGTSGPDGSYSVPNVMGNVAGVTYSVTIAKDGYESYTGTTNVFETNVDLGTTNLIEYLWTPYNLAATHMGDNARLVWEPAAAPQFIFSDFEADNGGWVGSGYGDWEWTNTYNVANFVDTYGSPTSVFPPSAANSGTGFWGTVINSNYSNSGAWSYLRQTFDLTAFDAPVLNLWHYMNGYNSYDYGLIKVNGTTVWGSISAASFMPWQNLNISLAAYANNPSVEISFEWYATTVVNYAGWYIDDIYVGPATRNIAQLGSRNANRSLQNYDVYRMLASDENTPANWTQLESAYTDTSYVDTGFDALPGNIYKWAVKANYSAGLESDAIISNSLGRVYTPQDITAAMSGANVLLSWTAEPGASFYKVYASDDPYGASWTYIGFSNTAEYTVTPPYSAYKFYKVTAAAEEVLPSPAPAKNTIK
jgi:hypothetical protein